MRHVIDGRVSHEVLHGVAARCGGVVEDLVEELVWALCGGQEVQSKWWPGRVIAVDDVLERVEVIAAGNLLLDAEDGGPELLYQNVLLGALPLHEIEDMLLRIGVWRRGDSSIFEDLGSGVPVLDCDNECLLRGDQVGLLNPGAVMPGQWGQ